MLLVLALSACDNELKLISRDFSVSLKSIDGGTAAVGKAVNCTFTVSYTGGRGVADGKRF